MKNIHDDVGSAVEPDVVFSFGGVRCNELLYTADAEWMWHRHIWQTVVN